MKKLILGLALLVTAACTNPSMERGLESLNDALAELEAQIDAADINQMIEDITSMQIIVENLEVEVENHQITMEGFVTQIYNIRERLAGIQVVLDNAATSEQAQNLLADIQSLQEGIDVLVFIADYDYDGIMNGFDQCPDTLLADVPNVNGVGCAPGQTPQTSTTTTTTD